MASTLLLNVQDALIQFGDKIVFDQLSFSIREGEKICLVGKNGAGKSTLMNIIAGGRELDEGERWQLQGATIGYLRQDVVPKPGQTVRDYIFEELKNQDGSHDYKIEMVVEPLEIGIDEKMDTLSGGQLRRAALARALVENPDILLLDEPTNHLDLDIIEWLETYLKGFRGAVVCISHDKKFLENMSDKVFWLDRGRLKICPRGFGYFEEWSAMLLEQEERELQNRQKVLDIEVEWASRGVKARRKRNVRRVELMKQERDRLRSDKRALQRMLAKIEFTPQEMEEASSKMIAQFYNVGKSYPTFSSPPPLGGGLGGDPHLASPQGGRDIAVPDGKVILEKFNLRIQRGDRIGIVGRNGSGKTTFLKMLVGELAPDQGTVKRAKDLALSYFDQKRKDLKPENTLQRTLCPNGSDYIDVMGKTRHICGYLKDFLFDPRQAQADVATLSGGQKNRLMLAKILANPGNLLILDEPTNDLDMDTLDMLEDMLSTYKGTLLVVSHDRDFLDQTVSRILAFEGGGKIEGYIGGYQDYLAAKKQKAHEENSRTTSLPPRVGARGRLQRESGASDSEHMNLSQARDARACQLDSGSALASGSLVRNDVQVKRMTYKQTYELETLPTQMEQLEREIGEIETELADPDLYTKDVSGFQRFSARLGAARQELATAEARWLELESLRAALAETRAP